MASPPNAKMAEQTQLTCTVVIPFFHNASFLALAVQSVINQSQPVDEIIIINDRSEEEWWDKIEPLLHGRNWNACSLIRNSGPSAARNLGVQLARSEYIAFLDADDFWHPTFWQHVSEVIRSHSLDFVASQLEVSDEALIAEDMRVGEVFAAVTYRTIFWRNLINTSSVVVRKSAFPGFQESLRRCEDYQCWLDILWRTQNAHLIHPPLSFHRKSQGTGGLSGNRTKMRRAEFMVIHQQLRLKRISPLLYVLRLSKMAAAILLNDVPLLWRRMAG